MAEPAAGPSRRATVTDEDEEINLEAGVPVNGAGPTTNGDDNDDEENGDGLPSDASETLYLHNLNEKVQVDGKCLVGGWNCPLRAGEQGRPEMW